MKHAHDSQTHYTRSSHDKRVRNKTYQGLQRKSLMKSESGWQVPRIRRMDAFESLSAA